MRLPIPAVLNEPGFRLYWLGTVLSNVGTRGTAAANLWQVLLLTNSTTDVGLVGLSDAGWSPASAGPAPGSASAAADRSPSRAALMLARHFSSRPTSRKLAGMRSKISSSQPLPVPPTRWSGARFKGPYPRARDSRRIVRRSGARLAPVPDRGHSRILVH